MGHFSVEIYAPKGSNLSENQQLELLSSAFLPLICVLVSIEWQKGVLTLPTNDELIAHFKKYSQYFEAGVWIEFVGKAALADDFWTKVESLETASAAPLLLTLLDAKSSKRQLAAKTALASLEVLSTDEWMTVIDQGGELSTLAGAVQEVIPAAEIKGDLYEALRQRVAKFAVGNAALRERWLALACAVSRDSRTTLMRLITDFVSRGETIADLPGLLQIRNSALLKEGDLTRNADGATTHIVLPLLANNSELVLLSSIASLLKPILDKADESTRATVEERLNTLWQTGESEDKSRIEQIIKDWVMTLTAPDDTSSEAVSQVE